MGSRLVLLRDLQLKGCLPQVRRGDRVALRRRSMKTYRQEKQTRTSQHIYPAACRLRTKGETYKHSVEDGIVGRRSL